MRYNKITIAKRKYNVIK